jgi:3-hydroxyisobutyrate dehydrogenase
MKAFLGMGLLGSNFVRAMLKRGEQVHVWNRTTSKAKDLELFGATAFENVIDAVKGAERIHVTLKDDASVDEVLEKAGEGFSPGAIIIDHTTTSKDGAIRRTKEWESKGFHYQHAPVFMGPVNALEGTGFMLVSGNEKLIDKIETELSVMTGKLIHFGSEEGKAAAMKLVGNSFLISLTAGLRDTLILSQALNVPIADVSALFNSWNPALQLQSRIERISSGNFSNPSWELAMARKDTRLFMEAANKANMEMSIIPVVASIMDKWIEKGFGDNDWTVIAKDAVLEKV